jgi:hypothetical protein
MDNLDLYGIDDQLFDYLDSLPDDEEPSDPWLLDADFDDEA